MVEDVEDLLPGGHLELPIDSKNTNLVEDVEDLLPVTFCQNPFSGCGEEVEKCFSQSEAWVAILDDRSAQKNTNLVEDVEDLHPVKFRQNMSSGF